MALGGFITGQQLVRAECFHLFRMKWASDLKPDQLKGVLLPLAD